MRIAGSGGRELTIGEGSARLMGIVNVTPDSFSDGGLFLDPEVAVDHALQLVDEGADILDLGAESTRPGHDIVDDDEQLRRLMPVLTRVRERLPDVLISVDTTRAKVAATSLEAGADWVNDTLALQGDPELGAVVAAAGCPIVLMHRFDPPRGANDDAGGRAVVEQIAATLIRRVEAAVACGIAENSILLDPGIGFGTRHEDNHAIHAHLDVLRRLGRPLLVGSSRKSFLGAITGKDPADRLCATAASVATLALGGVEILRVHDVAAMRDVVRVVDAFREAGARLDEVRDR